MAMAAPVRPAIRLWLSLVGMPNQEAVTLYTTMENSAAHSAMRASWVLPPKSTMLEMVEATEELMRVMTSTPRKLNPALSRMAGRTRMQRVLMQVAMALGASVHPLTKMTPSVSATVINKMGLEAICWRKCDSVTSMYESPLYSSLFSFSYSLIVKVGAAHGAASVGSGPMVTIITETPTFYNEILRDFDRLFTENPLPACFFPLLSNMRPLFFVRVPCPAKKAGRAKPNMTDSCPVAMV